MNGIIVNSVEATDRGKLYHCYVAGRPKALTKKQLLEACDVLLPEGPPARQPTSTLPSDYQPAGNGRDT